MIKIFEKLIISTAITLIILFLIIDSGGEKGLRLFSLFLIFVLSMRQLFCRFSLTKFVVFTCYLFLIVISTVRSILVGVDPVNIIVWVLPIISFPVFISYFKSVNCNEANFISAGTIFGVVIILLFIGRVTGNSTLMDFHDLLTSNSAGFFNNKQAFFSDDLPVVYFQGTLSLVFIGVLAWGFKRYLSFMVALVALILAPSRFGVVVLLFFVFLYALSEYFKFEYRKIMIVLINILTLLVLIFFVSEFFSYQLWGEFNIDSVRFGHLNSFIDYINNDLSLAFTGGGPGSKFYSIGINDFTDNIEISQLEILRKYGILFFIFIHVSFFYVLYQLRNSKKNIQIFSLMAHYVVSYSNPVLFSIPFLLYLSLLIAFINIRLIKFNKLCN